MERIRQIICDPNIGIDAWADSYIDVVIELLLEKQRSEEITKCFDMFEGLTVDEKGKVPGGDYRGS